MVVRKLYDVDELLRRFRSRPPAGRGSLVALQGLGDMDGYNPSAPISIGTDTYVLVRAEPRNVDFASWSVPFRQVSPELWEIAPDLPSLRLEDPTVSIIHGEVVVGGVRIVARLGAGCVWETVFFRGQSLTNLEEFARSPLSMKDVRLVELDNGRVGVFTRPWGDDECSRPIGYTEVNSLDELDRAAMVAAPLLSTQPIDGQWWGANAAFLLPSGNIGVLAHMARLDGDQRHYYAVAFVFDRLRREIVQEPEIIAERACFPIHDARTGTLKDVVFPAWIDRERGLFYGGLSDAAIGVMPIEDPFAAEVLVEDSQSA